jgi:molybdopterin synthase catalytic subunit
MTMPDDLFALSEAPLYPDALRAPLLRIEAGGFVSFEGWVRNRNAGRAVQRLGYQAYGALAQKEGARIVAAAIERHGVLAARCVHRVGLLELGDLAVWVGVSAAHRDAAFAACREIIDEIKRSVPIWKNEHYVDGESGWIHPEGG